MGRGAGVLWGGAQGCCGAGRRAQGALRTILQDLELLELGHPTLFRHTTTHPSIKPARCATE